MQPTGQIPPQPWMAAPETQALMAAFAGADIEARFIGGCVRDAILKRPVRDLDIATPEPPERVTQILEAAGIRVIPTGLEHGTVTAVIGALHFEITTLRIDVTTDGRRATVAYTSDWTEDAARRDFTINTLSCNLSGDVFDPYDGLNDLSRGRVKFVGRAEKRIEEDVLRLLRFFRFYAEYGRPPINPAALAACRRFAHLLPQLSGERVRGELLRILMAPHPADTVTLMRAEKVLEHVLPEAGHVGRLRMLVWLLESGTKIGGIGPDPVRRLAALLDPAVGPVGAARVADRLKFSNRERKHLCHLMTPAPHIHRDMDAQSLRLACYRTGGALVAESALLSWAGQLALDAHIGAAANAQWVQVIETALAWQPIQFPLLGRDALQLGLAPGPKMGDLLKECETWWIEGDFQAGREACLEYLATLIAA